MVCFIQVNISLSTSPVYLPHTLAGEMTLCVFSNEERGITFNTTLSETMSCDLTSSIPALPDIKLGSYKDYLLFLFYNHYISVSVTNFSLYSTHTKELFCEKFDYTFYNCSRANTYVSFYSLMYCYNTSPSLYM